MHRVGRRPRMVATLRGWRVAIRRERSRTMRAKLTQRFVWLVFFSPSLALGAPGDVDPTFAYPRPAVLEPDSTNAVPLADGFLVIKSRDFDEFHARGHALRRGRARRGVLRQRRNRADRDARRGERGHGRARHAGRIDAAGRLSAGVRGGAGQRRHHRTPGRVRTARPCVRCGRHRDLRRTGAGRSRRGNRCARGRTPRDRIPRPRAWDWPGGSPPAAAAT